MTENRDFKHPLWNGSKSALLIKKRFIGSWCFELICVCFIFSKMSTREWRGLLHSLALQHPSKGRAVSSIDATLVCCLRYCFALIVMPSNVSCDIIDFRFPELWRSLSSLKNNNNKKNLLYQAPSCRSILQISFCCRSTLCVSANMKLT